MLLRILDRWKLFGNILTGHSSKDVSQLQKAFVLTSKMHNMPCETQSLIVYVCFVIWCFILYRILWTHQSTVSFVLRSNVLTHISQDSDVKVKNVEISCFRILEHNNASKAGHTQILGWVCCIDFCSLKMVFSSAVKSGTFGLQKPMNVVISLL